MNIVTVKNFFNKGVLIDMRVKLWSGTGKLDSDKYNIDDANIDKEKQIRVSMDLLDDMSILKKMRKIKGKVVHYVALNSMNYPGNLNFIAKDRIKKIDKKLSKFQTEFEELRNEFVKQLKTLEKDFEKNHPNIYDPNKYPSEETIKSRFSFEYVFRAFEVPNKDVLPANLYKKEFEKFKKDIDTMKEEATNLVSSEIIKRLQALNVQIKDEKKNIHKGTLNAVENLIKRFDNLWSGFIDNKTIKQTISEMKKQFDNIDIDDNKKEGFKNEIKKLVKTATKNLKQDSAFRLIEI